MVKSSMNGIDSEDAADGPVVSAGGRSPSALSTGQGDMGTGTARLGPLAPVSCTRFLWTAICPTGGRHGEVQHERN